MNDMSSLADAAAGLTSVRLATLDLLRGLDMTTVFGNPGSTELPFLRDWPDDIRYVLALQEASAVAMADGHAQATGNAAFVNLHSAAGLGNALGNIFTAFRNQTPLVITAGQQTRSLLPHDPYLGADRPTEFPRPYIKWGCEPARAQDVPKAIAQAYWIAMQHPRGPTYVSVPSDDWDAQTAPVAPRELAWAFGPDPAALGRLAAAVARSRRPALVVGAAVDHDGAFELAVSLAERMGAAVWEAPDAGRASFPEDHPLFAGFLPAVPDKLSDALGSYDLVVVIGAPVFTFHVAGEAAVLRSGVPIYQVTNDPGAAARGYGGTTILATIKLALEALLALLPAPSRPAPAIQRQAPVVQPSNPISPDFVMQEVARAIGDDAIIVEEAPSHRPAMQRYLPIKRTRSFYTMASGGLGWGLPAAVGVALGDRRRVVCLIGDGSAMYSNQALWTAAQHRLPLTVVVLNNRGYGALRAFSKLMNSKDPPGLDLPGISFAGLAETFGFKGRTVSRAQDLAAALRSAFDDEGPVLVDVAVDPAAGAVY